MQAELKSFYKISTDALLMSLFVLRLNFKDQFVCSKICEISASLGQKKGADTQET